MIRTLTCASALFLLCQLPLSAAQQRWQTLRAEAEQLRKSDPVYALFKLEQAWKILIGRSAKRATKELKQDFAVTYGVLWENAFSDCNKLTANELAEHLRAAASPEKWTDWTITREKDGLYLTLPASALEHPGYCGNALVAIAEAPPDSELRKNFDRSVQEFEQQKARKLSLLPVVVRPSDKKYADLLRVARPIDVGQTKPIRFDLNAFLPKEFVKVTYPMLPYREPSTKSHSSK